MYNNILIPLDGSKSAEQAIQSAMEVAHKPSASLHLVQAVGALPYSRYPMRPTSMSAEQRTADAYLDSLSREIASQGFRVSAHTVTSEPAKGIMQVAEEERCDLIVMTSHGRSGAGRFFLGSVAERVMRHASCPVLLIGRASQHASSERASQEKATEAELLKQI